MSIDWSSLQVAARGAEALSTADGIKAALPIAYVLEVNDVPVQISEDKLVAVCPFHNDSAPSFDVYGEGLERFGCFPCGISGDVLDLIGKLYDLPLFPDRMLKARDILAEMPTDWAPPKVQPKAKVFDDDAAGRLVSRALVEDPDALASFLETVSSTHPALSNVPLDWFRREFYIGSDGHRIIIPLYTRGMELVGYKHRTAATKAMSAPGSTLSGYFYGEWRDTDRTDTVILCEGESDTWAAAYHLPAGYVALGLPAGAGAHPRGHEVFDGRKVVVAFDGDDAGRKAALKWSVALRSAGADVQIAPFPDGYDIAKMEYPAPYLTGGRTLLAAPDGIQAVDDVYVRPTGGGDYVILSNWSLEPHVEMLGTNGESAYECTMLPGKRRVTISSFDMSSKQKIVAWAGAHGGAWYGGDRDAQQLLGLLQSIGPFLTPGGMATVAGLHEGHFVFPGEVIGADNWKYVPPPNSVHLESRMDIHEGPWTPAQVSVLRDLHRHDVTDPILAWLAVAPIRSLLRQFPILAVTGSSGTGKTTLMETILQQFTGTNITTNLTSTTPHALFSFVGSTNAFPIWFDEYRPGARRATLESLQQVIRDAYTGQSSSKGGMGQSWAEITTVPAACPLVITGEDAFQETSHTERMIMVDLPLRGRNPDLLDDVLEWGPHGLAHAYLSWIHHQNYYELIETKPKPSGPRSLPNRVRVNLGVLELGWRLLDEFVTTYGGESLGDPDWSLITGAAVLASDHNPVKDALLWCLDEPDAYDVVMYAEGRVYVRVENFVEYVRKRSGFDLPGGAEAIRRYVVAHYGATMDRHKWGAKRVRALSFDGTLLGLRE